MVFLGGVDQKIQNDRQGAELGPERQRCNNCENVANGSKMCSGQKPRATNAQKTPRSVDSLENPTFRGRHGRGGLSDCDQVVRESGGT